VIRGVTGWRLATRRQPEFDHSCSDNTVPVYCEHGKRVVCLALPGCAPDSNSLAAVLLWRFNVEIGDRLDFLPTSISRTVQHSREVAPLLAATAPLCPA